MTRIAITFAASFTALLVAACSASTEPTPDEDTGESEAALANTGGGSSGGFCTNCTGCKLVYIGKDSAGCRRYECQCDSEDAAKKCIAKGGKTSAARVVSGVGTSPGAAVR
jgi:hypothetical protein